MTIDFGTVVAAMGGSGFVTLLITERVKAIYAAKLIAHKAEIDDKYQNKLELLKANLTRESNQAAFRYSKTFEKTGDAIAETYRLLVVVQQLALDYTGSSLDKDGLREQLDKAVNDFVEYFVPHEIYLEKRTSEKIRSLFGTVKWYVSMTDRVVSHAASKPHSHLSDYFLNKQESLYDKIPELLEELRDEFRRVLGLPTDEATQHSSTTVSSSQ